MQTTKKNLKVLKNGPGYNHSNVEHYTCDIKVFDFTSQNRRGMFRSSDLQVMSLTRFLCATLLHTIQVVSL